MRLRATGVIVPRDYALVVRNRPDEKVAFSPSKLAIAKIFLEGEERILQRIRDKAIEIGADEYELRERLERGIEKQGDDPQLLLWTPHKKLIEYKLYHPSGAHPREFGKVSRKSKGSCDLSSGNGLELILGLSKDIRKQPEMEHICGCEDNKYGETKAKTVMCMHLWTLAIAATSKNKEFQKPFIPFDFSAGNDSIITDVLFDYYVFKKNHFAISRDLLVNSDILTPYTRASFENDTSDFIRFEVLRDREKNIDHNKLTPQRRRNYGSVRELLANIKREMRSRGAKHLTQYSVEFSNTRFQTISQNYKIGDTMYSICTWEDKPPLMVVKTLGERKYESSLNYPETFNPFRNIRREYIITDDATRKEAKTRIIKPHELEDSGIAISKNLREVYSHF